MMRPAAIDTPSGWKADSPRAITSAFTNSVTCNGPCNSFADAVDLPAPLGPASTITSGMASPLVLHLDLFFISTCSSSQSQTRQPTVVPSLYCSPVAPPTGGLVGGATRLQWDHERGNYRLVTSQFVLDEAADGDPDAARRRLKMLDGIPLLLPSERVEEIAEELIRRSLMAEKAKLDALHVASAAVGGVHYLQTQNCKHIAKARVLPQVYDLLEELGLPRLLICTPAEFLGGANDDVEFNSR